MKIPAIKQLVEQYSIAQLQAAEAALLNEQRPEISIEGDDEGEQLTHVLAAIEILGDMQHGMTFPLALRKYTGRVRGSIQ